MFSGCSGPPDSKETKLRSINQETFPSASKNIGVVLMPCHAQKYVPTAISCGIDISLVMMTDEFPMRVTKIIPRNSVL